VEVAEHDVTNHRMEQAAASSDGAWMRNFRIPKLERYHCRLPHVAQVTGRAAQPKAVFSAGR
jgi:hypothetical protein